MPICPAVSPVRRPALSASIPPLPAYFKSYINSQPRAIAISTEFWQTKNISDLDLHRRFDATNQSKRR
jgi:hypothetical protein